MANAHLTEIEFDFDIACITPFFFENRQRFNHLPKNRVITTIDFALPIKLDSPVDESFTYKGEKIRIILEPITKSADNRLLNYLLENKTQINSKVQIKGTSHQIELPLPYLTDTDYTYPFTQIHLEIPYKLDNKLDPSTPSGLTFDEEKANLYGVPPDVDKETFLAMFNFAVKKVPQLNIFSPLGYTDLKTYLQSYILKSTREKLGISINLFTYKDAYKESTYKYLEDLGLIEISEEFAAISDPIEINSIDDFRDIVEKAFERIVLHVTKRRWISPFWNQDSKPNKPKKETDITPTLFTFLLEILRIKRIFVITGSDEGSGLMDLRFLYTTKNSTQLTIGAEFKLAHHPRLEEGLCKQLPQYLDSIETTYGFFIVMWFKSEYYNNPKNIEFEDFISHITERCRILNDKKGYNIKPIILDASKRPSASKL